MASPEENWRECCGWLTRMGLLSADHRANWPKASIRDLAYTLRDGVQLCRVLNLIQPNSLDLKDINQRPQMAQFLCLRNIRTFLQVCKSHFELKESELFQPSMLFDLSDFPKVIGTLSALSLSPKAKRNGIIGFSTSQPTDNVPPLDEDLNLEDLGSPESPEEDYYSVVVQAEEDIYQDLCYIDRQTKRPPVTLREKRDYVKGELLETEANYVEALQMLKRKFMKPLSNFMKEDDRNIIFFGIKELNEIHTGFLSDLTRVLTSTPSSSATHFSYSFPLSKTLGDVFVNWKEKLAIYGDYCANLTRAQNLTEEISAKNETLSQEIHKCEKEANGGRFKLRDLLSVPMQRVLKYHLLLKKLLDETVQEVHGYEEYESIEKAHDVMNDIAEFTNEVKRDSETLSIIRQIEGSIYDLKMPDGMELKDYGRLQKDGELRIRSHDDKSRSRYVFVFDKVMIMCKATRVEQYSYKHSLCLQEYRVEDMPSTGSTKKLGRESRWSFGWNLVHHKEKNVYTIFASTEEQKRRWIKAIDDALDNIQPRESRATEHVMVMQSFGRGESCSQCRRLLKGLFYQGYKCVLCGSCVHRQCIPLLRKCGTIQAQPPELPPRPLLLPIPSLSQDSIGIVSPTLSITESTSRVPPSPTTSLPLNNLNSPSTANGMRLPSHHYVNLNQLESFSWFAGELERETAQALLEREVNGTFLVRVRPIQSTGRGSFQSVTSINITDAAYALSLKWKDQVKHMKILTTSDEKLFCLSESRYFKSVVELIHWYQANSLAESFSGLDACLERPFEGKVEGSPVGLSPFSFLGGTERTSFSFPNTRIPISPS